MWEQDKVVHGQGKSDGWCIALQPFVAGDVVLIPPSVAPSLGVCAQFRWYEDGCVRYLMKVAFSHSLVERCMEVFPGLRNRLRGRGVIFPTDALKFGPERSSRTIRKISAEMNDMDRNWDAWVRCSVCYLSSLARRITRLQENRCVSRRDVRRSAADLRLCRGTLRPFHSLGWWPAEVGMNRSAFCSHFKQEKRYDAFFAVRYPIPFELACELLKAFAKGSVGDLLYGRIQRSASHFVRVFTNAMGIITV